MNIKTPLEQFDNTEFPEISFKKYIRYFNKEISKVGMKAKISQINTIKDDELKIINNFFPCHDIKIIDEGTVVFHFVFSTYLFEEFQRLNKCFKSEVFYYVKSKFLSRQNIKFKRVKIRNMQHVFSAKESHL